MPRWVAPVVIATTVIVAVVVGVLWYVIGGWPRDHDRYGVVPIPGQRVLELPEGEVRLAFEGNVSDRRPEPDARGPARRSPRADHRAAAES